ncbi:MAG: transglycosylase SLT domain-containing protein [Candidatus Rokubacteria bacterium]|nr:transglycosylase SLT domain-containing protein [Candidatus Rokubacteria bacterium]
MLLTLSAGLVSSTQPVLAGSFRFVDQDGVVHFTNAPSDPRYQQRGLGESEPEMSRQAPAPSRQNAYGAAIRQAAERYGVEPGLVEALIGVESAFDPWAVSRKGARGLMQLMPETAVALGVRNSFNPLQNIEGGVRYLRYLLDRYGGNLPLALAAYNAGPRVVEGYRGIPPYPETWLYVRRVIELYRNREESTLVNGEVAPPPEVVSQLGGSAQLVYRYADPAGSVTYTNIPPLGAGAPAQ